MINKKIILAGVIAVLSLSTAGGCKKKDATVQGRKPPVHEQIPAVKFTSVAPANLPAVQAVPGGFGKVEWINDALAADKTKVDKKNRFSIIGWAANDKDATIPSTVIIQLNATTGMLSYYAQASRTRQKRPEIAKELKNPALENSGFQLDADLSAVPQGTYMIGFLLSDGKYIIGFDTARFVVIE